MAANKIAKPIEKDILIIKPKKVVFKLPHFPEKVRSKRVFLLRMNEKELSEARWFALTKNWPRALGSKQKQDPQNCGFFYSYNLIIWLK